MLIIIVQNVLHILVLIGIRKRRRRKSVPYRVSKVHKTKIGNKKPATVLQNLSNVQKGKDLNVY